MYRVLIDYGSEGYQFLSKPRNHCEALEFATVDEAVKEAIRQSHGTPFLVVQVINWTAEQSA